MNNFWYTLGDLLNGAIVFDNIGDIFNWACIILGFVGFAYWMNWQRKFNAQAEKDPNQLK